MATRLERFWSKVLPEPNSGCWLWTGYQRLGYGQFWDGQRIVQADRWLWEHERAPIEPGHQLDHLCRTPPCVNPAHLEAVTQRENILRGTAKSAGQARQTQCRHGHPLAGANLYERRDRRGRQCLICKAAAKRRFEERRHAAA